MKNYGDMHFYIPKLKGNDNIAFIYIEQDANHYNDDYIHVNAVSASNSFTSYKWWKQDIKNSFNECTCMGKKEMLIDKIKKHRLAAIL